MRLLQFAGPIQPAWYEDLSKAGCQIVVYIPHDAYLVYADNEAFSRAAQSAHARTALRWNAEYLAQDKVHPAARAGKATQRRSGSGTTGLYTIQMVRDADANAGTLALIDAWRTGPIRRQNEVMHYLNVTVPLPEAALDPVAERPEVVSITPYAVPTKFDERQGQIVAGNLSGTSPSGPGYLAWLASMGFTQEQFDASGFVVDLTDSGIDNGTTNPNHFGLHAEGELTNSSRVVYARLEGTPNSGSTIAGCDGHGTLNAHIVSGYNDLSSSTHADSSGFRYGLGVCPFVKVGSSTIFDPDFFTDPDYENLISEAYEDGARISSDSWGADTFGGYDADAQAYDALVRDAQPAGSTEAATGNQEMTIVFAAGNAGPGSQTVGSPGTAKNVITVGAAENVHSHSIANGGNDADGNDGCDVPDTEADSADDMATFSSRGPCSDSRRKPEIVAPGTHVTGGVAQDTPAPLPTSTGNDLACFEATGVCALPGGGTAGDADNFFPSGQQFYTTSSGTSHSTPAVAGGCALVRQYFINLALAAPSPAMVKAFLMNAARYMSGSGANDSLWSNSQGMGEMNLGTAFDGVPRVLRDQDTNDTFTASAQSRFFIGLISDTGQPFRVTISWTDAPGSTSGASYNNDLDLSVTVGGVTYLGNVFSGAFSTSGGSADFRNNTESVFLPAGTAGPFTVTITAANINSDGIPNVAPALDQDFALVIYNGELTDQAFVALDAAAITAEDCGGGNGAIDPGEGVTVAFALKNAGNVDTTNVVATLQATGGVTGPSGPEAYGALVAGGSSVTQSFAFAATGTCGGTLVATLQLQDGAADLGTLQVPFTIGGSISGSNTYANSTVINLPGTGTDGPGSPYPSDINVAGVDGAVEKITVRVPSFSHTYPEDVDVLLVGPQGENAILMSAVGGGTDATGVDLVFDDDASSELTGGALTSGTYRPTDLLGGGQTFDAPAPAGPYGSTLSVFNGTDPNGTWSLYTFDAALQDAGVLALGWDLTIQAGVPSCCASNQPPLINAVDDQQVSVSNLLEFAVTATDPFDGDVITLSASNLPSWASFATVTNVAGVTNTFSGTPDVSGVSTVKFYAVDKDGADTETVVITVTEPSGDCGVIISEYIEGSSNNKAIEIYNGTADAIDLAADEYVVQGYNNGNTSLQYAIELTGTLASQDTHVLVNSAATNSLLALGDQVAPVNTLVFNGNDAVVLRSGGAAGTVVDSIGQVGFDPSDEWGTGDVSTKDNTLRRKSFVLQGDVNPSDPYDPASEWDGFAQDTFDGLGSHVMDCVSGGGTPPVWVPIGNKIVVVSNLLEFAVNAVPTEGDAVTLSVSNAPSGSAFFSTNETGAFTWTNPAPVGVYTTTFYAVDDDGASSRQITITVSEPGAGVAAGTVWINEIHYDNTGSDINEGVELAGPAGIDLSAYSVVAYNGANSDVYSTNTTSELIDDEGCGYGAVWLPIALQNGAPDGMALVFNSTSVVQFLSYEGSFTATKGPANGLTSDDIGVSEQPAPAAGQSLQLLGNGTNYADFAWAGPTNQSRGDLNTGQFIVPCGPADDFDGIPPDWELKWSGTTTGVVADIDQDGDGIIGIDEYILDFDPINTSNELFAFQEAALGSIDVTFGETTNTRVYTVDFTTNLSDGNNWLVLTNAVPGSNGVTTVKDDSDTPARDYRIRVHVP